MASSPPDPRIAEVAEAAQRAEDLRLLLLFGSRARGDSHSRSDWDFGYLAGPGFDPDSFLGEIMIRLRTDAVDLADLARANGLLRYRAAANGQILFEASPGTFESFWFEAVSFWCDAGPILQSGYETILRELDR